MPSLTRPGDRRKLTAAQLAKVYKRIAPAGTPTTMDRGLRAWLRAHEGVDQETLDTFIERRAQGVRVTLSALTHDPATEELLAPELLLALRALDDNPDALRGEWPSVPGDLDLLAGAFGRPFAC